MKTPLNLETDTCILKVIDGIFYLYTPNGEKFNFQKSAVVVQSLGDSQQKLAWARITLLVRLEDSK